MPVYTGHTADITKPTRLTQSGHDSHGKNSDKTIKPQFEVYGTS
jgi:hypothetical protein